MQLSIVGIALLIESLELDNVESCFREVLGVVFSLLSDGGGEPEGGGADGGIKGRVEGKDCLSRHWQDQQVILASNVTDEAKRDGRSCWRRREFHKGWTGWWLRG